MAIVSFDVFSNYSRPGPKHGHVNPRSRASVTLTAASVKAAISKLKHDITPDFYQVKKVVPEVGDEEAA